MLLRHRRKTRRPRSRRFFQRWLINHIRILKVFMRTHVILNSFRGKKKLPKLAKFSMNISSVAF